MPGFHMMCPTKFQSWHTGCMLVHILRYTMSSETIESDLGCMQTGPADCQLELQWSSCHWTVLGLVHTWSKFSKNSLLCLSALVVIMCSFCRSIPALIKFLAIGPYCQLEGFLFEIPGEEFGSSPQAFGVGVRKLLTCISEADPAGVHCMRRSYIGGRGWFFEFAGTSIFITTFAPCYGEQHSRHAFGVNGCFILFQPEYSFAAKNLPPDTAVTNWENPQTVRDRIRVAYRDAGREYLIRDSVFYSPALDIVRPLDGRSDDVIEWWKS